MSVSLPFPQIVEDYRAWYDLQKANLEYALRQKMFTEIRDKMVKDFIEELEPKIEEMVESIMINELHHQRNLDRMRDDIGVDVWVNIQKIQEMKI